MNWRTAAIACVVLFGVAQLVPVSRTNPPVEQDVDAPPAAHAVLERSCYDCHSHETRWPWYSRVAPVSWLVAHDVNEAREQMNFSTWGRYDAEERADHLEEIAEMVGDGEMPPWFYLPMHPDARLSADDLEALRAWTGERGDGHARHPHDD